MAEPMCCGFRESSWRSVWMALSVFFIVLTLVIVIVNLTLVGSRNAEHRTCGVATGQEVVDAEGSGGVASARYTYRIVFDGDANAIRYRLRWNTTSSPAPAALHLRGPAPAGSHLAPIAGVLCGAPGAVACSDAVEGELAGEVRLSIQNGVAANGVDVRTVLEPYREEPELYYLDVRMAAGSAARSQLVAECGHY